MLTFNISIMNKIKKIGGVNFIILLAYNIVVRVATQNDKNVIWFYLAGFVLLQSFLNLLVGLILLSSSSKDKKTAESLLLCSGLVMLVGFSSCLANSYY